VKRNNGILFNLLPVLFDPLFSRLFRIDGIYINQDGTKYSVKKIISSNQDKKSGELI
jgi:hypothetical protein